MYLFTDATLLVFPRPLVPFRLPFLLFSICFHMFTFSQLLPRVSSRFFRLFLVSYPLFILFFVFASVFLRLFYFFPRLSLVLVDRYSRAYSSFFSLACQCLSLPIRILASLILFFRFRFCIFTQILPLSSFFIPASLPSLTLILHLSP